LGKKELFDGLAIAELEQEWIKYPVIYIDLNTGVYDNLQSLKIVLSAALDKYEREWGITEKYDDMSTRFATLIETAYKKSNQKVELRSAKGRADAVVIATDTVYVFEFKITGNNTADDALKQIDDKGYSIPFSAGSRKIVKIGAEFSTTERGLKHWENI